MTPLQGRRSDVGITFSLDDKLRIAQKLDEIGIDLIEGGYPGSNPKDRKFFKLAKDIPFKNARVVAFGSTCRSDLSGQRPTDRKPHRNRHRSRNHSREELGPSRPGHSGDFLGKKSRND